jgi:UDP-N-acetylglucosamine 2-epimerase (non-hydrolysing)
VLRLFGIVPDHDLNIMRPGQGRTKVAAAVLAGLEPILADRSPDLLFVQGDRMTTLAASLAAYDQQSPVGLVEAGLRTGDIDAPRPEEMDRKLAGIIARLLVAQTAASHLGPLDILPATVPEARMGVRRRSGWARRVG